MKKLEVFIEHDPDTCREDWIVKIPKSDKSGWRILARFREIKHAEQWCDLIYDGKVSLIGH